MLSRASRVLGISWATQGTASVHKNPKASNIRIVAILPVVEDFAKQPKASRNEKQCNTQNSRTE